MRIVVLLVCAAILTTGCGVETREEASRGAFAEASSTQSDPEGCVLSPTVQDIGFSATKYPHIRAHMNRAIRQGWPRVLVLTRDGADERRDRLLADYPIVKGYDRDEYSPAIGRAGWLGHVEYVPASENRSHGATMGAKLRRFCSGTRFRYVFY